VESEKLQLTILFEISECRCKILLFYCKIACCSVNDIAATLAEVYINIFFFHALQSR